MVKNGLQNFHGFKWFKASLNIVLKNGFKWLRGNLVQNESKILYNMTQKTLQKLFQAQIVFLILKKRFKIITLI